MRNCSLYWGCIGTKGSAYLADSLSENRTLTSLDLGGNYIGVAGMHFFRDTLRRNKEGGLMLHTQTTYGRVPLVPFRFSTIKKEKNMSKTSSDDAVVAMHK